MRLDALPRVPDEIDGPRRAALEAICRAPLAISNAAGLGWCHAALADLTGLGYVVRWTPAGTAEEWVTLTPYGADRLGVDLDECGIDEHPTWAAAPPDDPALWPRRPIRLAGHPHRRELPRLDLIPCPTGEPALAWTLPVPPVEIMLRLRKQSRERRKSKKAKAKARRKAMGAAV